jgi:hypothetical protein
MRPTQTGDLMLDGTMRCQLQQVSNMVRRLACRVALFALYLHPPQNGSGGGSIFAYRDLL